MNFEIHMLKKPELREPVVVSGLPGSGYVAKLGVEHLVKELNGELFAVIYSHHFPPQVVIRPDGSTSLMKNELYSWRNPDAGADLILYTGDAQPITPDAEYELASKVLEITKGLGAKTLFTLAAYITGRFVETPKIYGTATELDLVEELKGHRVIPMSEGSITGMNGLLVGLAKLREIRGICLLGETSGYIVDAKASKAVLEVLTKMLNIRVNMTTLEERAKQSEAFVRTMEEVRRRYGRARPSERELGYIS